MCAFQSWANQCSRLILHFVPPGHSFASTKDRSRRTQLRSVSHPEGLRPSLEITASNSLIENTFRLASWAADELGALVTIENPARSHIWRYADKVVATLIEHEDLTYSACMYGVPYRHDRRVRCWNWAPQAFAASCIKEGDVYTCGADVDCDHPTASLKQLQAGESGLEELSSAWAKEAAIFCGIEVITQNVIEGIHLSSEGAVHRHALRGETTLGRRDLRRGEDVWAMAGLRNTADLVAYWPSLWRTMSQVTSVRQHRRVVGSPPPAPVLRNAVPRLLPFCAWPSTMTRIFEDWREPAGQRRPGSRRLR
jgi:hypothetical protein